MLLQLFKIFFSFQDKLRSALSYQSYHDGIGTATNNICFKPVLKSLHEDVCFVWGTTRSLQFSPDSLVYNFSGLYRLIRKGHFILN